METVVKVKCGQCGKIVKKKLGHVNRAIKLKAGLFCGQKCFGLSRRINKTKKELKKDKALYDKEYLKKNEERIKKKRHDWFMKDYAAHPEKYKKIRQQRMKAHIEYCRKPEYKKKKKVYDQKRVAKNNYGDFAEAAIALCELANIVDNRQAKKDQKIYNKSQKRKRNGKATKREKLESGIVGLYQPS